MIQLHATVLRLIRTFHVERKWLCRIRCASKCVSCAKGFEENSHWKMSTLGHGQGPGHATLIPRPRDFTLATRTRYRIFSSSCRVRLAVNCVENALTAFHFCAAKPNEICGKYVVHAKNLCRQKNAKGEEWHVSGIEEKIIKYKIFFRNGKYTVAIINV